MRMEPFLDSLFKLRSGNHNPVPAAGAADDKIDADTKYFPLIAAAGMGLLHLDHVAYIVTDKISHKKFLLYQKLMIAYISLYSLNHGPASHRCPKKGLQLTDLIGCVKIRDNHRNEEGFF